VRVVEGQILLGTWDALARSTRGEGCSPPVSSIKARARDRGRAWSAVARGIALASRAERSTAWDRRAADSSWSLGWLRLLWPDQLRRAIICAPTPQESLCPSSSAPRNLIAFLTLAALEVVLGIDNIVFISILSGKLPEEQRGKARQSGSRWRDRAHRLLLSLSWVMKLTKPLFTIGHEFAGAT
jgi:hypothetical protein